MTEDKTDTASDDNDMTVGGEISPVGPHHYYHQIIQF